MATYLKILKNSAKFTWGLGIILSILLFALFYPVIHAGDPFSVVGGAFVPPSKGIPLGTDNFGRDCLLELSMGTRTSLTVGLIAGIIATGIGLIVGLVSGYKGGMLDEILTLITNMFTVIPSFVILILVSVSISTRSTLLTAFIIGLTSWPWTARAVRAQTVSLRNRDHIFIAKLTGFGMGKIIVYEILPYIASYVVMAFIIQLASGILSEASVSMLGLGPNNTVSLGIMLNWALMFEAPRSGAWWTFIPPALSVGMITFSLYLMNLGMDEIFNPKLRS